MQRRLFWSRWVLKTSRLLTYSACGNDRLQKENGVIVPLLLHSRSRCTWHGEEHLAKNRFASDICRHHPDGARGARRRSSTGRLADSPECNVSRPSPTSGSS